jgi:probable rRNA maturation factor
MRPQPSAALPAGNSNSDSSGSQGRPRPSSTDQDAPSSVDDDPGQSPGESADPLPDGPLPAIHSLSIEVDSQAPSLGDEDDPAVADLVEWLGQYLGLAARALSVHGGDLSVVLVDDETMGAVHERHTGVSGTTDVLTFDLRQEPENPPKPGEPLEGELVLCWDEAQRQAQRFGHETRSELLLYAVHGLLHLLGENDHDEASAKRMHQKEDRLLTELGLGEVYHRSVQTGPPGSLEPSEPDPPGLE